MGSFLRRVLGGIGWGRFCGRMILQLACYVLYFAQPFLLRELVGRNVDPLWGVLFGLSLIMPAVVDVLNNALMQDVRRQSKAVLFEDVLSKPHDYVLRHTSSDVQTGIDEASAACRVLEHSAVHVALRLLAMSGLYTTAFFLIDPKLGVGYLVLLCVACLASALLAADNGEGVSDALSSTAHVNAVLLDDIRNFETILTSSSREFERGRVTEALQQERSTYVKVQRRTDGMGFAQQTLAAALAMGLVALGNSGVASSTLSQTSLLMLVYSVLNLTGFSSEYLQVREMADRLGASLSLLEYGRMEQVAASPGVREFNPGAPELRVRELGYAYAKDRPVLEKVSCDFRRGGVFAITGPNGSGKSTLLRIIAGLIPPDTGRIELPCSDQHEVMLLTQDATLFNRSILENVRYPDRDVDMALVMELARRLELGEVIRSEADLVRLTPGELEDSISGGERQKVLIMRAIAAAPQLLLCDEITSGLNPAASEGFYGLVREFLPATTVICSVHRRDELRHFDEVVSLDDVSLGGPPPA